MENSVRLTVASPTKAFSHTVLGDTTVKIGRSLKCDFSIPLEDLSREHCLFEVREKTFYITDLGSSNGVTVDRKKIAPNTIVEIHPESLVVLANIYVLNILPFEVLSKADVGAAQNSSAPKNINREVKTVTFQLEFPEDQEKVALPMPGFKKKPGPSEPDYYVKKQGAAYEHLKMIFGFIVVAAFIVYHFSTQQ